MDSEQDMSRYSLAAPATFCVRVLGHLDPSWSDELEGATIDHAYLPDKSSVTILTARLVDQAALIGLLNRLYGLGFPLISVECAHVGPASHQKASHP
jgi:hypothetical protein